MVVNVLGNLLTNSHLWQHSNENDIENSHWVPYVTAAVVGIALVCLVICNPFQGQRRVDLQFTLDFPERAEIVELKKKLSRLGYFPKQLDGKSMVFFNRERPNSLIKHPGYSSWKPHYRMQHQIEFKGVIQEAGFHHLVVPSTECQDDYLLEERLPIQDGEIRGQIRLYVDHIPHFTPAVREFTTLLIRGQITDLLDGWWAKLSKIETPRFDNALLYLDSGVGKIGLIDVEHYHLDKNDRPKSGEQIFDACKTALIFFPHHLDVIVEEAEKFCRSIQERRSELEAIQKEALAFFENIEGTHRRFLERHQITDQNLAKILQPSPQIKEVMVSEIVEQFKRPIPGTGASTAAEYFGPRLEEQLDLLKHAFFPGAIEDVIQFNNKRFNYALASEDKGKLQERRTAIFDPFDIPYRDRFKYDRDEKLIDEILQMRLSSIGIQSEYSYFFRWVYQTINQLFVDHDILAGYYPEVYGKKECLFF